MIYYELSDLYQENVSIDILKNKLEKYDYIKFYAFVLHNRTKGVKPHYHCMIQVELNNKKAKNKIEKDFNDLKPYVKCIKNPKGFARYLQHLDYLDKEQYLDIEVMTSNVNQFNDLKHIDLKVSKIENILLDFYNFALNEIGVKGCFPCYAEMFKWFLDRGHGNYFLCHAKNIMDMLNNSTGFLEDEGLKNIERSNNINVDIDNNTYCVLDNLI